MCFYAMAVAAGTTDRLLLCAQKWSSIEYDFTQHYDKHPATNGVANGVNTDEAVEEVQMIANQNI